MPGMGHKMPKDKKIYQDGEEKITKTMAQGRSGLYMDRDEKGKLPMDRVKLHYDRTGAMQDAKLEQMKEIKQGLKNVKAGFEYGGKQFAREAGELAGKASDAISAGTSIAMKAGKEGLKKVGDFIKSFDDRAQPTSNIKKRGSNSIFYQDKK